MTETEFVRFLERNFPYPGGMGIGDDCSVVRRGRDSELVTTDLLIEEVHFRLADFTPGELALKALAVNVSDIAAMGGTPEACYLGLGFPDRLDDRWLKTFFRGLRGGCRRWGLHLAGGDYSRAAQLLISITVVGRARRVVYRSGARPGDLIWITGRTGESALGWKLLESGNGDRYYARRHKTVVPELAKGRALAGLATSMIDVSDGLLLDLSRVLEASGGWGAEIDLERVPQTRRFRETCRLHGWDADQLALTGGEDYVLLFTLPPRLERRLAGLRLGCRMIGRVTGASGIRVSRDGRELNVPRLGYDHFQVKEEGAT